MSIQLNASSLLIGALAAICLAIVVQAQYNTFDSDSNSGKLDAILNSERERYFSSKIINNPVCSYLQ